MEEGEQALLPKTGNNSYTAEFKTMVIDEYICGKVSADDLAAKYRISTAEVLLRWVSLYNANKD